MLALVPPLPGLRLGSPGMNHEHDPDLPLLRAVARGDAAACAALVDRHLARLHAFAARLLGDAGEAEDVCQDTFLKLWRSAADWREGEAKLGTWLHQVALNACRDRLRRRRPETDVDDAPLAATQPSPERAAARDERALRVREAVDALPQRQREALVLCHFEGYGNIEAAHMMDVSVEALESLLGRARRTLRTRLSQLQPTHTDHDDEADD